MIYNVDRYFTNFEKHDARFIVYGHDYQLLVTQAQKYIKKIIGISYDGHIEDIKELPETHLSIVINSTDSHKLIDVIHKFRPDRVSFKVNEPVGFMEILHALHKFSFYNIDISSIISQMTEKDLDCMLNFYLHNIDNKLLVQPMHMILEALLFSIEIDIKKMLRCDTDNYLYIRNGEIGYYLSDGSFCVLGQYVNGIIETNTSQRLILRDGNPKTLQKKCAFCKFFFICRGFLVNYYSSCNNWLHCFNMLQESVFCLRKAK